MENHNLPAPKSDLKEIVGLMMLANMMNQQQSNNVMLINEQTRRDDKMREDKAGDKQNQFFVMMFVFLFVFLAALIVLSKL